MASPTEQNGLRGSWRSLAVILLLVIGGNQAWAWWRDQHAADLVKRYASAGSITMYSTTTCPYCAKARAWLDQHAIPWQECHIDTTPACQRTFEARGAPGTPLMLVNGHWRLGFDAAWVAQALQAPNPSPQARPNSDTSPRP